MKALLIVDVQNGFCPGGNLPVADGHNVVPVINKLMDSGVYDLIVASRDWHPENHGSFASQHPGKKPFEMGVLAGSPQMMWPAHCVQGSVDAEYHPGLNTEKIDFEVKKGMNPEVDSYSAFRDNARTAVTGLDVYLKDKGVKYLDVCGLATDYCVRFTIEDAVDALSGVKVRFIEDASRGITADGVAAAKASMKTFGVDIVHSENILGEAK
jgi:nicotinamidase/pyrazinamidase